MKKTNAVAAVVTFILASFCVADAQQTTSIPRIGLILSSGTPADPSPQLEGFRQGLRDLGYEEGKNVLIERRYGEGRLDRIPPFVHEFVEQKVDVIVAGSNVAIKAAKEATKTIPVVMISTVDPVAAGYVKSFAHPGGNITGIAWLLRDTSAKRVELLKEVLPKVSRVGVLWDTAGLGPAIAAKEYEAAAKAFKLDFWSLAIRGPNPDFMGAFQTAKTTRLDALIVVANPLMGKHAKEVFELATKNRLPSMTEEGRFVRAGGLISYGPSFADLYRRAAGYVHKILKGANPGDLQVRLPEKFEIFINLKTAKQLGLAIPKNVLIQADKVIK